MEKREIKKKCWIAAIALTFICLVLSLTAVPNVSARPYRLGKIPDKGAKFGCGTCHVNPAGGGPRNPFGTGYEKVGLRAGDKYTSELGSMDSDGDGCSNDQEFAAGTNPGDPQSKPAK
ncbi:thrombospondin type 3 repeat-containing protein [Thermodesulfobacteriota bacterium]